MTVPDHFGLFKKEPTASQIDAGGAALRAMQQGSKKHLLPWDELPNAAKKKWREYARIVLSVALNE